MIGVIKSIHQNDEYRTLDGDTIGSREISHWLSGDIQDSIREIDELIVQYSEFAEQKKSGIYLGTGNAHSEFAHENFIYLYCQFDEEQKVLLTTEQMIPILEQYKTFIVGGFKPCTIEVEYLAEGQEAEDQFLKIAGVDDLADLVHRGTGGGHYIN